MQSLLKIRSNHSLSELRKAATTILDLEEDKEKADQRIAELERDVKEANDKADEMEGFYMAVAFGGESEGENEEKGEKEEEDNGEEKAETSRLLKQVVAMSKKNRNEEGADEDGSKEDDEDDEEKGDEGNAEDKERDLKIHNENEDLFKDMMGSP